VTAPLVSSEWHRLRHGVWLAGGLATALVLLWSVTASEAGAVPSLKRSDPDALRLLRNAAAAARSTPYEGTQFITTWSGSAATTSLVGVAHSPGQGTYIQVRRTTADPGGTTYESDSDDSRAGLTGFTPKMLDLMARNYVIVHASEESVAGRPTRVVEAHRSDGSAAGRFWIDRDTGLMLRRDLIDGQGRAVNITGFFDIRIAEPRPQARVVQTFATLWGHELTATDLGFLRNGDWTVPRALPGRLELYEARQAQGEAARPSGGESSGAVHLAYSDGLSAVSVFVQRGSLDERLVAGWREARINGRTVYEHNALQRWAVWASDGYVYTVLADAPQGTADAVVAALPHADVGFWGRLGRGLVRLGSRLNPFD
jgi:sigma-E factor negative regulatory protein RseB